MGNRRVKLLRYWLVLAYRRSLELLELRIPRAATALNFPERGQRPGRLQHRKGLRRPAAKVAMTPDKHPTKGDVAIAQRLLAAYAAAGADGPMGPDPGRPDLWTLFYAKQGRFIALLARGDAPELAAYLCNVARHDAALGFGQGPEAFEHLARDPTHRRWTALLTHDRLVSLAEAVGALEPENPEDTIFRANLRTDSGALVEDISRQLGIDIAPPDVDGGHFKLMTPGGMFAARDLWAIYTAHLVQRTLESRASHTGRGLRVCEIGGGGGRAAYWAWRLGLRSYTIIDLPHVNVVQGYYLLKSLPGERIVLYGEPDVASADDRIRILPQHAVSSVDGHAYDLVLNQDSFPEMSAGTVDDYLAWIKTACAGGLMLSINGENRPSYYRRSFPVVTVPDAVERVGGFARCERYPYWLRRGYVTELYRVAG